jgi:hypothetical protein
MKVDPKLIEAAADKLVTVTSEWGEDEPGSAANRQQAETALDNLSLHQ